MAYISKNLPLTSGKLRAAYNAGYAQALNPDLPFEPSPGFSTLETEAFTKGFDDATDSSDTLAKDDC